jgi:hypothetical protein
MLNKLKRSKYILSKEPRGKDDIEKEIVQAEMNIEDTKIAIQEQTMFDAGADADTMPAQTIVVNTDPKKERMAAEDSAAEENQFRQEDSVRDSISMDGEDEESFSRRSWTFRNDDEERGYPVLEDHKPAPKSPSKTPESVSKMQYHDNNCTNVFAFERIISNFELFRVNINLFCCRNRKISRRCHLLHR